MNGRIAALSRRVQELTASELGAMDKAARAALYAGGARMLSVVNNDTVVALALLSDGGTEWLGSNKPVVNLLDNSDFRNPINQRGQGVYTTTWGMSIDRWYLGNDPGGDQGPSTMTLTTAGIKLERNVAGLPYMQTRLTTLDASKLYTLAWFFADGRFSLVYVIPDFITNSMNTFGFVPLTIKGFHGETLAWAALYEGAYTADTLPPYTPKGYAAELAECLRYYQQLNGFTHVGFGIADDNYNLQLTIPLCFPMRTTPVVSGAIRVYNSLNNEPVVSYTLTGFSKNALVLFATVRQDATLNKGQYLQIWISSGEHFEFSAEL